MVVKVFVFKPTELLKSRYTRRTGSPGNYRYYYDDEPAARHYGSAAEAMRETAKQFVNKVPEPVKINAGIRARLNAAVQKVTPGNYYDNIPLDEIDAALRSEGYLLIQEDNTEWSGFLMGDDSGTLFTLGDLNNHREVNGRETYAEVANSGLRMTWYKMSSGRYEIVKYVT